MNSYQIILVALLIDLFSCSICAVSTPPLKQIYQHKIVHKKHLIHGHKMRLHLEPKSEQIIGALLIELMLGRK